MTSIVAPGEASGLIHSDAKDRVLVAADQREALLDTFELHDQTDRDGTVLSGPAS